MVFGDEIVIEITEPQSVVGQTVAHLENIFYNYRETGNPMIEKINESDPCQVNVNCTPEGDNWQEEDDGVARILVIVGGSAGWCTGSLVNNTAQDCKPYFLTALHCGDGASSNDLNNWTFYFGYEAPGCTNPSSAGTLDDNFIQSCFLISDSNDGGGNSGSDFMLVQLGNTGNESSTITTLKSFNARWNGWDINNTTSGDGVSIHHPAGDIKKISTYTSNLQTTQWGSAPGSHWRVTWSATTNGHGVTEGGSSGSPIFRYTGSGGNEDSKIIGTLTGGSSFCTSPNNPDQYGKMSYHWNSNGASNAEQLEPWLDPGNTGATVMNGSYDPCSTPAAPVADFTANQTTILEGDVVQFTDLTSGVPTSWSWTITPGTAGVEWEYVNTTSSTSQNPEVQFNTAGTYTVELTATNGNGSDTETKVDYITVNAIVCGDPLNTSYTMGFETGEDLSQWVVLNSNLDANSNGDANTWRLYDFSGATQGAHGGTNVASYFFNDDAVTAADDWIITGCMDLVAGATYTLSYWWTTDADFPENLEVFIGDDQTAAAMTTSLQDLNGIQDNTWNEEIITFTVPSSGEYYIGWHCTSAADQWYVAIDDINLSGVVNGLTIINAPGDISIECDESTDPSNTGDLTASTGCSTPNNNVTITYTDAITAGSCTNAYTITRTWTATDNCGNSETHVQTITIEDNTAPVVTCGQSTDQINTGSGSATAPDYTSGSTFVDNCTANGNLIISQNPAAGSSLTPGTHTIDVMAEDECGNIGSCQVILSIINTNGITITTAPSDISIECDELTDPSNTGQAIAQTSCTTNGGAINITYADVSDGQSCPETITRTWTVTDDCGNTETYDQSITIEDLTAPTANLIAQVSVECAGDVPAPDVTVVTGESDNCTANPTVIFSGDVSNGQSCPETITRTYIVSDDCGNEAFITQTIVVEDVTAPTASNPSDISVFCAGDVPAANPNVVTASDNCSSAVNVTHLGDVSDGLTCPETITRSYIVEDDCGNFTEVEQTIVVNDDVAPSITCTIPEDTVFTSEGNQLGNYISTANVSDNCTSSPQVTQSPAQGSALSLGANIVTLTVTDDCGNQSSCTIEVLYEDNASIDKESSYSILIYPNPVSENLTVNFGHTVDHADITLYDANGRQILKRDVHNTSSYSFSLSHYAKGLYTVVIQSNGLQTIHKLSKQ